MSGMSADELFKVIDSLRVGDKVKATWHREDGDTESRFVHQSTITVARGSSVAMGVVGFTQNLRYSGGDLADGLIQVEVIERRVPPEPDSRSVLTAQGFLWVKDNANGLWRSPGTGSRARPWGDLLTDLGPVRVVVLGEKISR